MIDNLILLFQNPLASVDLVLGGLLIGAIFALIAYGMALVWGVMNIINIAQGEFVILGGFVAFYFSEWGVSPLLAVPVAAALLFALGGWLHGTPVQRFAFGSGLRGWLSIAVLWGIGILVGELAGVTAIRVAADATPGSALGIVSTALNGFFIAMPVIIILAGGLYGIVIRHIVDRDLFTSILATFGISIFLQQVMNEALTAEVEVAEHGLDSWSFFGGDITIEQIRLAAFVFAIAIGLALVGYLRNSRSGQAIRATAQNARAARIMGIDTDRVYARTFALNAAICGAAGALVAMIWAIQAYGGLIYTVRGFMVVIFAGLGNLSGVIIAGLGLGAAENLAGFILGLEFQIAFVFGLLVVVLIYRRFRLGRKREYLK